MTIECVQRVISALESKRERNLTSRGLVPVETAFHRFFREARAKLSDAATNLVTTAASLTRKGVSTEVPSVTETTGEEEEEEWVREEGEGDLFFSKEGSRSIAEGITFDSVSSLQLALVSKKVFSSQPFTKLWRSGGMSNFDYLMNLNTLAGRTYNDLSQYPVMPWILQDYSSDQIDLNDPAVFRDLSKPIGALNEKRLQMLRTRCQEAVEGGLDEFLYGSHYSTMGTVMYFLLRLEPFMTYHKAFQVGIC